MKYYESFGQAGFHSAFMTTFAFGAQAFEDIPFPRLKGAGCRNIVVLADRAMTNQSFADFGPPLFAGSSYHLIKADARAAFHPKITMLLGERKGKLMIGSANLTALGLGGNKETVAAITYDEDRPEAVGLFATALRYVRYYMPQDYPGLEMCLERALRFTPWLTDAPTSASTAEPGLDLALLYDQGDVTIQQQITSLIGSDPIRRLIVISPFWDQNLEGLQGLQESMAFPETHLLLDPECRFPIDAFTLVTNTRLYDMKAFAQGEFLGGRFLHAKLIIAEGLAADHVISGSMNCTSAALTGRSFIYGNAEAGIYKRMAPGTACLSLGLVDYDECSVSENDLPNLKDLTTAEAAPAACHDGGALVLASNALTWTARKSTTPGPSMLRLYDRDGAALGEDHELGGDRGGPWSIAKDAVRPRYGEVHFSDGTVSSPVIVTDLDTLAVTTRPVYRGRKRTLINALMDAVDASLSLMEILRELQDLDAADRPDGDLAFRGQRDGDTSETEPEFRILSYEDFVRLRTAAKNGTGHELSHFGRHDRASSYVADCLNRLIGLVGPDLASMENAEFDRQGTVDLGTTEPDSSDLEDANAPEPSPHPEPDAEPRPPALEKQAIATAKKLRDAVDALEKRCLSLKGKAITTDELVRVRLVLHIILDHAQPASGTGREGQILPIYTTEAYDWPRLIGRALKGFLLINAESRLQMEPNEIEQHRVLECLATCDWAAEASSMMVNKESAAACLRQPLKTVRLTIHQQCLAILQVSPMDTPYFDEVRTKCADKYGGLIG